MMNWINRTFETLSGERTEVEQQGSATKMILVAVTLLAAAGFSSIFGVAVGSTEWGLAFANILKVPTVVVLSGLFALPSAILALRVIGSPIRATDMWLSQASATLAASLVLASAAPLIGLFYHSSDSFGGIVSVGTAVVAVLAGLYVFGRSLAARIEDGGAQRRALVPAVALVCLQLLAVVQLIGVVSPILPEVTPFSQGAEGLVSTQ